MSSLHDTERAILGPDMAAAWMREHGDHLMDYAVHRLGEAAAPAAVAAALGSAHWRTVPKSAIPERALPEHAVPKSGIPEQAVPLSALPKSAAPQRTAPERAVQGGVSERGLLFAALRGVYLADPGHRDGYHPGTGPGLPDAELMDRAWALVDPLGVEALLLMFRHELTLADLAHVLGLPEAEAHRLVTRTQDLIETLVSGLDALSRGRATCERLVPLVAAAFPAGSDAARAELLHHMIECSTCNRPFNIHYTVPQMIDQVPVVPLGAARREELLALLPAVPDPAPPAVPRQASAPAGQGADLDVRPPAIPTPGKDTPLFNALASVVWAREVLSPTDQVNGPAAQVIQGEAVEDGPPPARPRSRLPEALAAAGARTRGTAVKVAIMLAAGTAGMITGLQVLGPPQSPPPETTFTPSSGRDVLMGRLTLPPSVSLDEFGRGTITLNVPGEPVSWRISAPGLAVTPSTGTSGDGDPAVVQVRALRFRHWCGDPSPVEAVLTVHGPADSLTTRVRWNTC
ncbi:hypothetical protein ACFXJ8_22090 [Nonomuraea sp. NPDC059194]|uniref:hypothetical protein n=1 Tax=Nonomuraea sp. NPDC059194 TaxID=3346764 RepID=UPI0036C231F3